MSTTVTTSQNAVDVSENNNTIIISQQPANQVTIQSAETKVSINEPDNIVTVQVADSISTSNTEKQIVTVTQQTSNQVSIKNIDTDAITVKSGIAGPQGERGISIINTTANVDGTFTIEYSDGSTFISNDLTGPRGISGLTGFNNDIQVRNISASGDFSASGVFIGSNLSGTNTGDQNLANLAITGSNVTFAQITGSDGKFEHLTISTVESAARLILKNTGGTSANFDISTYDNNKLTIGGINLITLDNANNFVGIGETVPTEKLHVVGNIKVTGAVTSSNLSGTNTGDQSLVHLALTSSISGAFHQVSSSFSSRVTTNDAKTGYTDALVKTKLNAENVISSSAQLPSGIISGSDHIFTRITSSGDIQINVAPAQSQGLIFNENGTQTMGIKYQGGVSGNPIDIFRYQGNTTIARFMESGNVGIGITTPGEKLEVIGNISASGIIKGASLDINGAADISGDLTSVHSLTAQGVNATSNVTTPLIQLQNKITLLNKTQTAYLDLGTRDVSGPDAVFNLSNIGNLTASGNISASGAIIADEFRLGSSTGVFLGGDPSYQSEATDLAIQTGTGGEILFRPGETNVIELTSVAANFFKPINITGNITASGNMSGSGTGSFEHGYIAKDLIVDGIVVASEIHTTFVSSSVTYATSSNQFGDSADDKHMFTGSIEIKGLIKSNGLIIHSGSNLGTATTANLPENTNLYYTDARVKTKLNVEGVISSSVQIGTEISGAINAATESLLSSYTFISSSDQIKSDISGSWQGQNFISSSQIVMFVSGAYGDGSSQLSKTFTTMSFDYGTGIHVSESANRPGEALISLGSAFHTISASNGNAKATGSDTIIFEAGNNMTVQVTQPTPGDANSHHKMTFTSTSDPIPAGTISSSQQVFTAVTSSGDISASGNIISSKIITDNSQTSSFGYVSMNGKGFNLAGATKNDVLMFDGTNFRVVNLDSNPTFEFVVNSFTVSGHGSGTQLIGTSTWKAIGAITYSVSYKNGPATTCNVTTIGEGNVVPVLAMTGIDGNSAGPTTNTTAIHYPSAVGNQIYFRLNTSDGVYSAQLDRGTVTFRNYWVYGPITNNTTKTAASIGTILSAGTSHTQTFDGNESIELSLGASDYLAFAHRTSDTNVNQVQCGSGNNKLTVAMNPDNATSMLSRTTVSNYQNTKGFQEDFNYYVSKLTNLSSHSTDFELKTSTTKKNYIYWGAESTWTSNEANVESLTNKDSSDDGTTNTLTGTVLSTLSLEDKFAVIAIPTRHLTTSYQLFDNINNQPVAFETPDVISITNPVGFQENYNVFRSSNKLGSIGSAFSLQILIKGI